MTNSVRYYIPTRGRVGKQLTLENLPVGVRHLVTLVCPEDEVNGHLGAGFDHVDCRVVAQPPEIQTIGQKREWIFKTLAADDGVDFAWQLDDDLTLKTLGPGQLFKKSQNLPDQTLQWFQETEPRLREEYPVLGLGTSYFAPKGGVRDNYHLGFAWGMNRAAMGALQMNRMDVFEDIDFTLQMLRKGFKIGVCYDVVVDQKQPDAPGGVTGERTPETIQRDVLRLMKLHDGIVSMKPLRSGAHPAAITRVNWMKAAKEGGLR
jgi:hypothetical protein